MTSAPTLRPSEPMTTLVAGGMVTEADLTAAVAALVDPAATVVAPMTVAAWGRLA